MQRRRSSFLRVLMAHLSSLYFQVSALARNQVPMEYLLWWSELRVVFEIGLRWGTLKVHTSSIWGHDIFLHRTVSFEICSYTLHIILFHILPADEASTKLCHSCWIRWILLENANPTKMLSISWTVVYFRWLRELEGSISNYHVHCGMVREDGGPEGNTRRVVVLPSRAHWKMISFKRNMELRDRVRMLVAMREELLQEMYENSREPNRTTAEAR